MPFRDRVDAGRQLAELLKPLRAESPLVLALPRGGVPVGYEVARALGAPLEIAPDALEQLARRESAEVERRVAAYRDGRPLPALAQRTIILVDDGVATGATARAAIRAVREHHPRRLVFAAPVIAAEIAAALGREVDELVSVASPGELSAVGDWYDVFTQTGDDEVRALLGAAREDGLHGEPAQALAPALAADPEEVSIHCEAGSLEGILELPPAARGLVVFAHGSGSSRHSPRNQHVARALREAGLATLLLDLLTPHEERIDALTAEPRFDVERLARRLGAATRWATRRPDLAHLPIGYFGASTGAAAALLAAARMPEEVRAIVSRGGRPDLAGARSLALVRAPTLFLVGGQDREVLQLNREARACLEVESKLVIVPGAAQLFEEPGALDTVGQLAAGWFARHLPVHAREGAEPFAQEVAAALGTIRAPREGERTTH